VCFSATASFAAAGLMAAVGAVSLHRNASREHGMLVVVPLLFAAQQAAEGLIWLTIADAGRALPSSLAIRAFLGFAWVVWPVWLPLSLLCIEPDASRRRWIRAAMWIGAVVSLFGVCVLVLWRPAACIAQHSIRYDYPRIGSRWFDVAWLLAYIASTVAPFLFLSTVNVARSIGVVLLIGLIATLTIEASALTSVWCFFATTISLLIALDAIKRQRLVARIA
jgi:hypothetical protein